MKKLLLGLSLILSVGLSKNVNAQALEQGQSEIDVYYGGVSFGKALWLELGGEDATAKFLGVMGLKYEYMVSDKMGVGAEFNYTDMQLDWSDTDSASGTKYEYNIQRTVIRFMPRFNIHFGSSESFDGYFGVAAGYRSAKSTYSDNNPNNTDESIASLNPMALRLALGGRYFFTDNIGLHMEFGIGGGMLLHGGLSIKF